MNVLAPGNYLIELEFNRHVDYGTLLSALEKMGFVQLTPDDTAAATIGALPLSSLRLPTRPTTAPPKPPIRSFGKRPVAPPPKPPLKPVVKPLVPLVPLIKLPSVALKPAAPTLKPFGKVTPPPAPPGKPGFVPPGQAKKLTPAQAFEEAKKRNMAPAIVEALRKKAAQAAPAPGSIASAVFKPISAASKTSAVTTALKPPIKSFGKQNVGPGPLPGSPATSPSPDASTDASYAQPVSPDAAQPAYDPSTLASSPAPAKDYGGGGGGGGGGAYDEAPADAGPPPDATMAPEPAPTPEQRSATEQIVDLWRRWVEWGSPFASGPNVSGEEDVPFRFRFIATLVNPLRIFDKPGMKWLYVRKLTLNPFSDLDFSLKPFALRRGATYEIRFLSRSKAMPNRDSVKNGLVEMGFAPMKLAVMKRNMRVPQRAGTSVTMWYGIGSWEKGSTMVTHADPFFFLNAKEITS